ncbi:MAG: HU family DNA-binding protein [Desulfovibrionales bacterium]
MSKSKNELINNVAEVASMTNAQAKDAVNGFLDSIILELGSGGRVGITGFGSFSVQERPARKGRNPKTGETIEIPAKKALKFKPSKKLEQEVS